MIFLDSPNKSLQVVLGTTVTTNQLIIVASYTDQLAIVYESDLLTNNTTAVTVVSAPTNGSYRVSYLSVFNNDTISATVTVQINSSSNIRKIFGCTLAPNEMLMYFGNQGWSVFTADGTPKVGGTITRMPAIMRTPLADCANLTAVTVLATTICHCYYMGVCPQASSSINLLANVTALVATITWAEIAIYKGTPILGGNCTDFTRLGYADVAAIYNATGIKNTAIPLTIAANAGDNLWVVLGSQATTPFQIRGALADNLQSGMFQTWTMRPSLTASGSGTLAGAAVVPGWVNIKVN